jgi:hypothetical protein
LNSIILHKVVKKSRNRKNPRKNLSRLLVTLIIICCPLLAFSQEQDMQATAVSSRDSSKVVNLSESNVIKADTAKVPVGDINTTVNYKAKDSINFNLKTQDIIMYNTSHVDYGDIELDGDKVKINYATKILEAEGLTDSTGKVTGKPVFTDKGQVYQTEGITYNFDSRKAIITGVVTQQGEAYMHSEWIKKNEKDEIFGVDNIYTTCNLEHPHFGIAASKIKLIPNDKILAGPFNLELNEIATPFLFPFGLFPMPNKKSSGILFPTYGEEKIRGFFLRNGGYYWAVNDYVDMRIMGDIYSKGSFGLSAGSTYKKRYSYTGNLNLTFNQQNGIESELDSSVARDFWFTWSHRPESKGTGRFSASVQGGTNSYNRNNPVGGVQQAVRQTFNSSVSYSNVIPNTPFNYAISARHDQNVATKEINILLPEVALNMNRQYPFKSIKAENFMWLEKLNYSYNFVSTNKVSNNIGRVGDSNVDSIADFSVDNIPYLLKNANNGGKHRVPISTSFNLFNFITASPTFNYEEVWYLKELNHFYDSELKTVAIDTLDGFSRAGSYSAGIGFTTRLYGMVYPNVAGIQALRHVLTPSISMNWRPDFGDEKYGIYKEIQTDSLGNTRIFSKYDGFSYGSPGAGQSANIGFSLNNVIEMKVKTKKDTSDTAQKIKIFDNLSLSSAYNVLADSFKLSNLNLSARTNLFNRKLDVNFAAVLNPYVIKVDSIQEKTNGTTEYFQSLRDQYAWEAGGGLGRFTSFNIALSTNLNPKGRKSDDENRTDLEERARETGANEDQVQALLNNPNLYVDFEIPWNLRISYNFRWSRLGFEEPETVQALNFSGDINFTDNWKVGFTSGYDIDNRDFTMTSFSIFRNLHCWQINANWVPFGRGESFSVDIGVKASILQDLKLNRRRTWQDNL